jgi:hypothetical protein
VPYTRAEYRALSRRERKQILLTAAAVLEYNRAVERLALLYHLSDAGMLDRISYYEGHCRTMAEGLPTAPEWKRLIKEL